MRFRPGRVGHITFSGTTQSTPACGSRKLTNRKMSIRFAGLGYRALGVLEGSTVIWFWIGLHADYDRLI